MMRQFAPLILLACMGLSALPAIGQVETYVEPPAGTAVMPEARSAEPPATADETMRIRAPKTLSLWDMLEHGGVILWVIAGMGFIALLLSLFLLMTVTARREAPHTIYRRANAQINAGDLRDAFQMCEDRDELLARVLCAGLRMAGRERYVIQDAMESEAERGATALWQRISYLQNIAQITPLLGLLGTVWGMMQAFGSIAFDEAQVKGINMAYSVSTAMVTTAAGLAIAIPVLAVYYILRGRVIKIAAQVEAQSSEMIEPIAEGKRL